MTALFLGIDPGKHGGLALIDQHGALVRSERMPDSDADLLTFLLWPSQDAPLIPCRAVLEAVHGTPQMGTVSAFTFGAEYGRCRMALAAARLPFDLVSPMKWQRRLECLSGGDKGVTKARAQQLFPHTKVTHAIADSLLLAEYCRLIHGDANGRPPSR